MPPLPMFNIQPLIGSVIAALAALSALLGVPLPAGSSVPVPVAAPGNGAWVTQQQLIDATNRYRAQHGLHPLEPMPELNALSQGWADHMARVDRTYHNPAFTESYPAGWRSASENVLQAWTSADADAIVHLWASSPGHRNNMLDPAMTHFGVGVADAPNGKRFATQNFARY